MVPDGKGVGAGASPGGAHDAGARVEFSVVAQGVLRIRLWHEGDRVGVPAGLYPELEQVRARRVAAQLASGQPLALDGPGIGALYDRGGVEVVGEQGRLLQVAEHGLSAGPGWAQTDLVLEPDAMVFGLGAKTGRADRRGRRLRFWNTDQATHLPDTDPLYASLPQALVVSQGQVVGVALLWGGDSTWDIGHGDGERMRIRTEHGGADLLVAAGPQPQAVLDRLSGLLGRPCLPPRWALGYQQSHWGYADAAAFTAVVEEFRRRGLPLDAVCMDLDYMQANRPLVWDRERFPDPAGFLARMHAPDLDVHVVLISNAGMPVADPRYAAMAQARLLVEDAEGRPVVGWLWGGDSAFTDFLDPRSHALWQSFYRPVVEQGIDGVWNDMNEPSFLEVTGPDVERHGKTLPDDAVHHGPGDEPYRHAQVHNVYPLLMNQATYTSLVALRPDERPFVLSRSGYLGAGRYGALWTGDNASWWEHLRASLPAVMGLGLAGVPFAGVDIGGFQGEATGELLARWMQAGCLMPLCRNHSVIGAPAQEPYAFGPRVEAIARRALRWRYALLPTLYSLVHRASTCGEPLWRPLGYAWPDDAQSWRCEDEVMVGDDLLHAPVLEPQVDSRRVYLPAGAWYRIDEGFEGYHRGGGAHLASAPLEASPLFARGGAVLAVDPSPADRVRVPKVLQVWLFPAGRGHLTLFEDDGHSFLYRHGRHRCTDLDWEADATGNGTLRVRRSGSGPGAQLRLRFLALAYPVSPAVWVLGPGTRTLATDWSLPEGDFTVQVTVDAGEGRGGTE